MIRRSFRIGLWLGLIAGIGAALMKLLRSREAPSPALIDLGNTPQRPAAWPPLEAPVSTPAPVEIPEPAVEASETSREPEPGLVVVGDAPLQPAEEVVASDEPLDGEPTTAEEAPAPAAKKATPRRTPARTAPPAKKAAARKAAPPKEEKVVLPPWVAPEGQICPPSHPIKAKLSSQLFHLPGMFAYNRTTPDRCYASAEEAEADGLRSAKR